MADRFLWGAATSAHQVEGNNIHNDWWEWEKNRRVRTPSGIAADHYHRFRDDFALAKKLGHNAHRLSIEWSRIELARGQYHPPAIAHYREVLQELRRLGLTTFVTLHHFTNPLWFAHQGGWENPQAVLWFTQYVQTIVGELGELVDYWVTINEPNIYVQKGYWEGVWPPGKKHAWYAGERVTQHLAAAHQQVYRLIHTAYPQARVGIAQSCITFIPAREKSWRDQATVHLHDWHYNHRFFRLTRGAHDFIGLNYYFAAGRQFSWHFPFFKQTPLPFPVTTPLSWSIYPPGLTKLLIDFNRYRLPIFITENGLPDALDQMRPEFIRAHIRAIEEAQRRGVRVQGYLHWALLDNFEWAEGFTPRFGLVAVDYATQQRTPRPSAYTYQAVIAQVQH